MSQRAFTLVEMLACLALAALLMIGVLQVTATTAASHAALRQAEAKEPFPSQMLELLQWDLANARSYDQTPGVLELRGYASLHAKTLQPLHRPAAITYRLQRIDGVSWLVRSQASLDLPSNRNEFTEPVAARVSGFAVESLDLALQPEAAKFKPIPQRLRLTLERADAPGQPWQRVLVIK